MADPETRERNFCLGPKRERRKSVVGPERILRLGPRSKKNFVDGSQRKFVVDAEKIFFYSTERKRKLTKIREENGVDPTNSFIEPK